MNLLITGATGFVGKRLVKILLDRGDSVHYLGRRNSQELSAQAVFHPWQMNEEPALPNRPSFDAVIHLAGEPVAQRWDHDVKRKIFDSRVHGTRNLVGALAKLSVRPSVLVSASAIGYYGDRGEEILTEESEPGEGFLAEVCVRWEQEAVQARNHGIRVVPVRISTVLGREGGALPKMLAPFKAGIGGKFGSGQQWISWIHIRDLVNLLAFAADTQSVTDVLNGSSPQPVTNADFTRALARAIHRPALLAVPRFALRLALGEMAEAIFTSARVVPQNPQRQGFSFEFPILKDALEDLVRSV